MEMSNMVELLPCPHCGNTPTIERRKMYGWVWVYVVKCSCGAETFARYSDAKRAVNAWNEGDITLL